jgi:hypothetical protein
MTSGFSMQAMTLTASSHSLHVSLSMLNMRLSRYDEDIVHRRSMPVLGYAEERTLLEMTVFLPF